MKKKIIISFVLLVFCFAGLMMGVIVIERQSAKDSIAVTENNIEIEDSESQNVTLESSYGFQGVSKFGKYLPVQIVIHNDGSAFQGTIQVILMTAKEDTGDYNGNWFSTINTKNYLIEKEVEVKAQSDTKVEFAVPLSRTKTNIHILLKENEETVADKNMKVDIGDYYSQFYIGVLSDSSTKLSYFDGVSLHKYADLTTRMLSFDESTFPSVDYALESLDMLFIDQFEYQNLSSEQIQEIKKWVANGGVLVLAAGDQQKSILSCFQEEGLFAFQTNQPSTLTLSLSSLLKESIETGNDHSVSLENYEVSIDQAEQIYESDGHTIFQKIRYGNGSVVISGIDFAASGMKELTDYNTQMIVELIQLLYGKNELQLLEEEQLYYDATNYWSVSSTLSSVMMKSAPSFLLYCIILVVYVFLSGPLLYFILKRLDKRNFFWITECALAGVFMLLIIGVSSKTRFRDPFINYFSIVSREDNVEQESTYFNIRAPYNNAYELTLDSSYSIRPISESYYSTDEITNNEQLDDYNVAISYGEDTTQIQVKDTSAFSKEYFLAEKTSENTEEGDIKVDCSLYQNKISGTLSNTSQYDLENAAIVLYNKLILIHQIKSQETVDLSQCEVINYSIRYQYGVSNLISEFQSNENGMIDEKNIEMNQKKLVLDFYLMNYHPLTEESAVFLAFRSNPNDFQIQTGNSYSAYGMSLYEQPIKLSYEEDGFRYHTYVSPVEKDSDTYDNLMISNELVQTYQMEENQEIESLSFETVDCYDDTYYDLFHGTAYFYNCRTNLYDPVAITGQTFTKEDLAPYLNDKNQIIVKYSNEQSTDYKEVILPYVTYVGRDSNAEN